MAETTNYKMTLPSYTSSADIKVLNENFKTIDNGISPFYVATLNSRNVYKITTGLKLTSLKDGFSIKVAIPSDSDTTYTYMKLIVDDCGEVLIKKPNGNNLVNFKANGVYNLTYYNSVFILVSGGDESDTTNVGSDGSNVLEPHTFIGSDGEIHTGSMPERGNVNQVQTLNGTIILPEGHYNSINITQNIPTKSSVTNSLSTGWDGAYTYARIPQSAYFTNASSGYPEIKTKFTDIANTVGLTPDKVVGNVGGVVGTVTGESLRKILYCRYYNYGQSGTDVPLANPNAQVVQYVEDDRQCVKIKCDFKPKFGFIRFRHSEYSFTAVSFVNDESHGGVEMTGYHQNNSTTSIKNSSSISIGDDGIILYGEYIYQNSNNNTSSIYWTKYSQMTIMLYGDII